MRRADPGDEIAVRAGVYREKVSTVRSGSTGKPISIVGPQSGKSRLGRYQAVLTTAGGFPPGAAPERVLVVEDGKVREQ